MSQTSEIADPVVTAIVAAVIWLAWSFLSETRHNHGFWVAFLMPLAPVIIPLLWVIYIFIKSSSYIAFILLRRREEHEDFMRELRTRSGIFLFFK